MRHAVEKIKTCHNEATHRCWGFCGCDSVDWWRAFISALLPVKARFNFPSRLSMGIFDETLWKLSLGDVISGICSEGFLVSWMIVICGGCCVETIIGLLCEWVLFAKETDLWFFLLSFGCDCDSWMSALSVERHRRLKLSILVSFVFVSLIAR